MNERNQHTENFKRNAAEFIENEIKRSPVLMTLGLVFVGTVAGWLLLRRPMFFVRQIPKALVLGNIVSKKVSAVKLA